MSNSATRQILIAIFVGFAVVAALKGESSAKDKPVSPEDRSFFENKIRPVLVKHCYECHSADSEGVGGKLLLDTRDGVRTGGESGPSVVPGKPDESRIIQALRYDGIEMPPEQPLPETVINNFYQFDDSLQNLKRIQ